MSVSRWLECLEHFEVHLGNQNDALASGDVRDIVPFSPPSDLGPLPDALAPRAAELLDRAQSLAQRLQHERDLAAQRLLRLPRQPSASASFVDGRL